MRGTFLTAVLAVAAAFSLKSQTPDETAKAPPFEVIFSKKGGFYAQTQAISLETGDEATIFFTLDGSRPTEKSNVFRKPILLDETTVIRAFAKKNSGEKSRLAAQTFLVGEPKTNFPVVSISISPGLLFNEETGLFEEGPNVNYEEEGRFGANYWSRKEVACHVEIFETDGRCVHNSMSGFRLFGGFSRVFPQKSMVLVARKELGKKFFKHEIFGDGEGKKFKYLVLRNGGSDWGRAQFRDALMGRLTDGWDIEKQAWRPSQVYINGKYWGFYDIREKINARFLADHSDADRDSIDLIEHRQTVKRGSIRHYRRLLEFIDDHNLADLKNYQSVNQMMDVENFMDYQIAEIYCDNTDAGGNIRFWRPKRPDGRWRWILFDTDWGFGLHDPKAWANNSLDFFTEPNGPEWPNPAWSTFLLRHLLRSKTFETAFVTRFCDRLNTSFSTENVLREVDFFEKTLAPELPRHWSRWKLSEKTWRNQVAVVRQFGEKRPSKMLEFLQQKFPFAGQPVAVEIEVSEGGSVILNENLTLEKGHFSGKYFENLPISLRVVPKFGFRFVCWEGFSKTKMIRVRPNEQPILKAIFERYEHPLAGRIFFNEACPTGKESGDWVEIFNGHSKPVNLRGWSFSDGKNEFELPEITLAAGQYLILAERKEAFQKAFPLVKNVVGDFGFGLDRVSEKLFLFGADGGSVDSAFYQIEAQDGQYSIDLLLQKMDNGDPENWKSRAGKGSPAEANPMYLAQIVAAEKELWLRVGLAAALLLFGGFGLFLKRKRLKKA